MSLPCYLKYKPSGVEWLGDVPEHWGVLPIKQLGKLKGGAGFPHGDQGNTGEELPFYKVNALGQADRSGVLGFTEDSVSRSTATRLGAFIFPAKTVVFAKVGAALLLGRIRTLPVSACLDNNMMGVVPAPKTIDAAFLYYAMALVRFDVLSNPGAVPSINAGEIGEFRLPTPPLAEQSVIAEFLDRETTKIDDLIEEQRRLIELLKEKRQAVISHAVTRGVNPCAPMKPSGIEWLGEVPEHWELTRMGNMFREVNEAGVDELPILSVSIHHGVSDSEMSEEEMDRKVTRSEDRSKYIRVRPGDLVYNMMRAWQGGFGTVKVEGMVSPAYVVARPLRTLETVYIENLLRTPQAVEEMRRHSRGITDFRLRLYWDEFKNIRLALPPLTEARAICAQIVEMDGMFQGLSAVSERAIGLLEERRTALISAAVTGQIDVCPS